MRKYWLPAFYPFSTMFFNRSPSQDRLKSGLFGKELKREGGGVTESILFDSR